MDSLATQSLLNALLECFENLNIDFLVESTINGEDGYQRIINSDVVTVWETYFCSAIVKLSKSPRRNEASPNPDALRAWRREVVNDKTKSTLLKKFIPTISSKNGHTYIDAQKEHIIHIMELAICAEESTWDIDRKSSDHVKCLYKKKLIKREHILPYIYSKFELLKESFESTPIRIMASRDDLKWFSDTVANKIPEIDNDENERKFAAILAAAMLLSLNIKDKKEISIEESIKVDKKIEDYLYRLFGDEPKNPEESHNGTLPVSRESNLSIPQGSQSDDADAEAKKSELIGAFDSLKFAKNENGILESMIRIKRSIGKCFNSAEDLIRILPDDDSEESSRSWIECAYRLKDKITEMVSYYRVVLEREMLTQDLYDQELTSLKLNVLDTSVEIYVILGFLEAQLKKEFEELNRSAGKIEKEQIRFRIRKTKMDLTDIRREYEAAEINITSSIAEHNVMPDYDIGTI